MGSFNLVHIYQFLLYIMQLWILACSVCITMARGNDINSSQAYFLKSMILATNCYVFPNIIYSLVLMGAV